MGRVLLHEAVDSLFYRLVVAEETTPTPGQFYMLYPRDRSLLLGRAISVYDWSPGQVSFVYRVFGKGTAEFSTLRVGDELRIEGPYGQGFPMMSGKRIGLVGGGVGIAPLYYTMKMLEKDNLLTCYLGLREESEAESLFQGLDARLIIQKGGLITDGIVYDDLDVLLTCGPPLMMETVMKEAMKRGIEVYASLEERMGCGFGACLACTCETKNGRKRVCKDGPVFRGEELMG